MFLQEEAPCWSIWKGKSFLVLLQSGENRIREEEGEKGRLRDKY
jgi:hypothetical protein